MVRKAATPPDPETAAQRERAEHAEKQRDDLAAALRDVLDAHYTWREHGEGQTGARADAAAQRFIDARCVADAALAMAPRATAAVIQSRTDKIVEAAQIAFMHATSHEHDGIAPLHHFVGALAEQLGLSTAK